MIDTVHLKPALPPKTNSRFREIPACFLNYGLRHMILAADSTLRSIDHVSRLAHAKSQSEVMSLSNDYYQQQMDILDRHTRCTTDMFHEIALQTAEPFRTRAILSCSVIL